MQIKTTYTFSKVYACRSKRGKCRVCGKRMARQRTFWHTVNPFNKNSDGQPKTYSEVQKDVDDEANEWEPDWIHEACR